MEGRKNQKKDHQRWKWGFGNHAKLYIIRKEISWKWRIYWAYCDPWACLGSECGSDSSLLLSNSMQVALSLFQFLCFFSLSFNSHPSYLSPQALKAPLLLPLSNYIANLLTQKSTLQIHLVVFCLRKHKVTRSSLPSKDCEFTFDSQ